MIEDEEQVQAQETGEPAEEETAAPEDPVAAALAERDQYKALAQRTQADFINYKRRTDEERSVLVRNAANGFVTRLLPVLDDLERAAEALPEEAPESWSNGVRMIIQNFHAVLQSEGIAAYQPEPGDDFDPVEHEAVFYQPTAEQPAGTVLVVTRRGYRNQDRVLRPAQVVIAREPEDDAGGTGTTGQEN